MGLGLGGNKISKKRKNKAKEDLYKNQAQYSSEDALFDEEDEFEEYDKEIQNRQQNSSNENSLYNEENTIDNQEEKKGKKNIVLIVIGIVTALVLGFLIFMVITSFLSSRKDKANPTPVQPQVTITSDNEATTENSSDKPTEGNKPSEEKKDVSAGIPDLHNNTKMTNTAKPTDPKDFMKDIKGEEIPKAYTVVRIENVSDFVNYTKKRAIMGDGVELYWLEADYKGQPYVITVPYQIFKEMDDTGITVINAEVLHLKDGHTVVSYMSVNPDAKRILQRAGKQQ